MTSERAESQLPGPISVAHRRSRAPEEQGSEEWATSRSRSAENFRQILKSSALIGTSSLFNIVFAIARTKALAMMLGPSSFGLMATYSSIVDLSRTVAQMGVNASGVRQMAQSAASGDEAHTAATSLTLKRVAFGTASLGALAVLCGSSLVSQFTFGSLAPQGDVALLSLAVFFGVLAGGQTAVLQGLRRISDLSQMAIIGTFAGTLTSIALVYFLREKGLAFSLVSAAAISAVTAWVYSSRIKLPRIRASLADSTSQARALLKLGTAFMLGDLLVQGAAYLVRIIVLRDSGLIASGLYQAAWTLGGLYVGFVLQSMATDFYPRLVACIEDKDAANLLVNQQATVSILLAGPGVIATLTFAPLVVHLLYSAKFDGSIDMLRWICFGMALRTISWPMGFIIAAAGRQTMFLGAEFSWAAVNVALTAYLVAKMGTVGAGVAFFVSYIFHVAMLLPLVRHLTGFRWTRSNVWLAIAYVASCCAVIAASYALSPLLAFTVGALVCASLGAYSAVRLVAMSSSGPLPKLALTLMRFGRWLQRPMDAVRATWSPLHLDPRSPKK